MADARDSVPAEQDTAAAAAAAEQNEVEDSAGEDADAIHAAAADLFRDWLAEHKAQLAREEEVWLPIVKEASH